MEAFLGVLLIFYIALGVLIGGITLANSIDDEELTKGRLIIMIVFLPQTMLMGTIFTVAALVVWTYETIKYSNDRFTNWWESPVRIRKGDK